MKKLVVGVLLVLIVVIVYVTFDLNRWLSLEGAQEALGSLQQWRDDNYVVAFFGFLMVYILVVAFSIPGAAVLTPLAGALFGLRSGLVLTSIGSTVGATLAMLITRYLIRDWIEQKFARRVDTINKGVERDGAFYLLTLRLAPVFPFFLINVAMGLTRIKTLTYMWVSMIGMLPGTFVFVNAGTQLADITSLSDVLSPLFIASLLALAVLPWIGKTLLSVITRAKVYSQWTRPRRYDTNIVVIGAGAAGLVSSYIAATVKAKVTLVEEHAMGGDCLNYGCVPSKALISAAHAAHATRHADRYGVHATTPHISLREVMNHVNSSVHSIAPHDSVERYTELGVDVLQGHATITDPWTVEISASNGTTRQITTRNIIIAAGATPTVPPIPGLDDAGYLTSDTIWSRLTQRKTNPKRIVVLGGGPIGCELSQALARLGIHITVVEMTPRLMSREDPDVSNIVTQALQDDGVTVLTSTRALRAERRETTSSLVVERDGAEQSLDYDELLIAVGRSARLDGYGLDNLGLDTERTIVTNDYLQTTYPNIYAIGDVAGPYQFTHTASHQAWYATVNALFGVAKKFKADYRVIPATTFISPEVARVGVNETEAAERNITVDVTTYDIKELDRAITESATHGFVKVLTEPGKDRILGVTIVAQHAGEMIAEYVLAMKHNIGLNKILGTIHAYPTWSEANKYAAGTWKQSNKPKRLLALSEKIHTLRRGTL